MDEATSPLDAAKSVGLVASSTTVNLKVSSRQTTSNQSKPRIALNNKSNDAAAVNNDSKRRRRIHKRTLAIVFCFGFLPWILIAIPGTQSGGGGSSFTSHSEMRYGWPLVHLHTTEAKRAGGWVNGKFVFGLKPTDLELNKMARDYADSFADDWGSEVRPAIEPDLRFYPGEERLVRQGIGHWSESQNWPRWKPGWHWSPRYVGLLLNLAFLSIVCGLVLTYCENRIRRRGRIVCFSLRSLLIAISMAALLDCLECS